MITCLILLIISNSLFAQTKKFGKIYLYTCHLWRVINFPSKLSRTWVPFCHEDIFLYYISKLSKNITFEVFHCHRYWLFKFSTIRGISCFHHKEPCIPTRNIRRRSFLDRILTSEVDIRSIPTNPRNYVMEFRSICPHIRSLAETTNPDISRISEQTGFYRDDIKCQTKQVKCLYIHLRAIWYANRRDKSIFILKNVEIAFKYLFIFFQKTKKNIFLCNNNYIT